MTWSAERLFRFITPRRALAIVLVTVALSLLLRSSIPLAALGDFNGDDELYVRFASSLLNGDWLGDYNVQTLIKGAFYPIFIAGSYLIGLPLKVAEQAAYLMAVGCAAWMLWRLSGSRLLALSSFVLLAFNPLLWHPDASRVLRECLYVSLGLALFAAAATTVLVGSPGSRAKRYASLFLLGLLFAAYWLTREESVWLYPSLTILFVGGVWRLYCSWRETSKPLSAIIASVAAQAGAVVLGFALLAGTVATLNYSYYGVFLTNEIREGNFASAYGAIMRIEPDHWERYAYFTDDVAAKAYRVSPAARELQRQFENGSQTHWRTTNCEVLHLNPCPSGPGSWFIWSLRSAMNGAGYFQSAPAAQAFEDRLATEINRACDDHAINCLAERKTMAPPFRSEYVALTWSSTMNMLGAFLGFALRDVGPHASSGTADQLQPFVRFGGSVSPTNGSADQINIRGWSAAPNCAPRPSVVGADGQEVQSQTTYAIGTDVIEGFGKKGVQVNSIRFWIRTNCLTGACRLVFFGCSDVGEPIPIGGLKSGPRKVGSSDIYFDDVTVALSSSSGRFGRADFLLWLMRTIGEVYYWIVRLLVVAAIAGIAVSVAGLRNSQRNFPLIVIVLAAAAAVASRSVLLAYIDATSWPSVNPVYLLPGSPFVALFGIVGTYLGIRSVVELTASRQAVRAKPSSSRRA